jgi:hypothetical protein
VESRQASRGGLWHHERLKKPHWGWGRSRREPGIRKQKESVNGPTRYGARAWEFCEAYIIAMTLKRSGDLEVRHTYNRKKRTVKKEPQRREKHQGYH